MKNIYFKKIFPLLFFLLLPTAALANCDFSVAGIGALSQKYLDANYGYNPLGLAKPKLIVSSKNVHDYYAEEIDGVITIYPKEFDDSYCDPYFDGLTPFIMETINHEYIHYLDEKLHLSRKIGEKPMSEKTAYIGEHVLKNLLWNKSFTTRELYPQEIKKYNKLLEILQKKKSP